MNSVNLIGRLTRNPIMSNTINTNTRVAYFTLAVQVSSDKTDFIRIVAYGKTAEFIEKYITKGQRIGLSGRLNTYDYIDSNNVRCYGMNVITDSVFFA